MKIGAFRNGNLTGFKVWAPLRKNIELHVVHPHEIFIPLEKDSGGYWSVVLDDLPETIRYYYRLDNDRDRPDPCSFYQPHGVHASSEVYNHSHYSWSDSYWKGINIEKMIMYELHIGTFTEKGDFESVIERLDDLKTLGINAIDIMPVAQFPGKRNWGYDGVYPFAVQNSYGGPTGFKKLIDSCHQKGMAVILDVVYNHIGPEGNYLWDFAPYFTEKYHTPWGSAINFDGAYSNAVREYFIQNALYWLEYFHIDGLRLDAIHGIYDFGAKHILDEMNMETEKLSKRLNRKFYLIAESDLNDPRIIHSRKIGGYELDAQWSDDFHHAVHAVLTGEKNGYYEDFGKIKDIADSYKEGFVYKGQYSKYRKRNHGSSALEKLNNKMAIFIQNHDQIGNRMFGERLATLIDFDALKLCAGALLISPNIPLLFMGEEYGEDNPFYYFVNHEDLELNKSVCEGRKQGYKYFGWHGNPPNNPDEEESFLKSKINWNKKNNFSNKIIFEFYRDLIDFRKKSEVFEDLKNLNIETNVDEIKKILILKLDNLKNSLISFMNFSGFNQLASMNLPVGIWKKRIDSCEKTELPEHVKGNMAISLQPYQFVVYEHLNNEIK